MGLEQPKRFLAFMDEMGREWGLESVGTKKMCGVTFRMSCFFFVYILGKSFFYEYFRTW